MYSDGTATSDPWFQLRGMPNLRPYASISGLFWRSGVVFKCGLSIGISVEGGVGKEASEVEGVAAGKANEGVFFW